MKDMNNNGFTLTELIVCIAIVAALGLAVGLSARDLTENSRRAQNEEIMQEIFSAATIYNNMYGYECENVGGCKISELIEKGLLDANKNNPMYDGLVKISETLTDYVQITKEDGMKKATYYCVDRSSSLEESQIENETTEWGKCYK